MCRVWSCALFSALFMSFCAGAAFAQSGATDKWDLVKAVHGAAEKLAPVVVSVETRFDKPRTSSDYLYYDAFRGARPTYGLYGSGILYKGKYVLTCDDITEYMEFGRVELSDGRSFPAKLLGENSTFHVAVLELEIPGNLKLPQPSFLPSDKIRLGMPAAVVGRSLNAKDTFATEGVVSAIRKRTIGSDIPTEEFIQFDANFELTFTGGALADVNGNIFGMVYGTSGINLNLAVPIDEVLRVADKIIAGDERVAWFGADLIERSENIDVINGFHKAPYKLGFTDGLFVTYVEPASPADLAGLQAGDVVETVNGKRFDYLIEFTIMKRRFEIGQQVKVVYWRKEGGGVRKHETLVTILPTPESLEEASEKPAASSSRGGLPPGHP
ncbi:MAG: serine protease [bacterium]|jgi:S1-C subfamily serine protease